MGLTCSNALHECKATVKGQPTSTRRSIHVPIHMIAASSAVRPHSSIAETMQCTMPSCLAFVICTQANRLCFATHSHPLLEYDGCIDGNTIRLCSSTRLLHCAMRKVSQQRVRAHVNLDKCGMRVTQEVRCRPRSVVGCTPATQEL